MNQTRKLRSALQKTVKLLTEENQPLMADILTRVVIEAIDKFQKKLNVGLQDSVGDLLDQFRKDIETEIFEISQQWTLTSSCEKFLFPRNCRFVYTKGRSTVAVIEQEPGLRTITLDRGLLDINVATNTGISIRKSLHFPYVLFILRFRNGHLVDASTAWRKESLRTLQDILCDPLLPNTHSNYNVCLGNIARNLPSNDISGSCENFISDYWQSVFNCDLALHWWQKKDHPKIATVDAWEENSSDPFLFNDITLKTSGYSVESIIDRIADVETSPDSLELKKRLSVKVETCSNEMFSKVMKYFKKSKFERFYPKDIEDAVGESILSITQELCDLVLIMQNELQSIADKSDLNDGQYDWQAAGPNWSSH